MNELSWSKSLIDNLRYCTVSLLELNKFWVLKLVIQLQWKFRNGFSIEPPSQLIIRYRHTKFMETRNILHSFVPALEAFNQGKSVYKAKHLHVLPHKDIKHRKTKAQIYWCVSSDWCPSITKKHEFVEI